MKDSFYLKHDLDARDDEKVRDLLIRQGARGYGVFWMICEDLHRNNGRLQKDYKALAWTYREDETTIRAVVEGFGLFYDAEGSIASRRVDSALVERALTRKAASVAGKASAVKRALSYPPTRKEGRKEGDIEPSANSKRQLCETPGCGSYPNPNHSKCPPCEQGVPV